MINYMPVAFYGDLVARDGGMGCHGGDCHANGTQIIDTAKTQWEKFSQGAKIGIIVGAAVGATLLLSVLAFCLWRFCRKRQSTYYY